MLNLTISKWPMFMLARLFQSISSRMQPLHTNKTYMKKDSTVWSKQTRIWSPFPTTHHARPFLPLVGSCQPIPRGPAETVYRGWCNNCGKWFWLTNPLDRKHTVASWQLPPPYPSFTWKQADEHPPAHASLGTRAQTTSAPKVLHSLMTLQA